MNKLIEQAITEYNEALTIDSENTDSLFFILDEIGTDNNMNEQEFNLFCNEVNKGIEGNEQ